MDYFSNQCEQIKNAHEIVEKPLTDLTNTNDNMMGVQYNKHIDKFMAVITHKNKIYRLGNFDTIEEAHAQYIKYKALVNAEKCGGAKVDLTFGARKMKKNMNKNMNSLVS